MVYDINELRSRVDDYLHGTLSQTDLGKWAENAYYDLLKGGYMEIKKIALYPFQKTLSSIHIPPNDVKDIYPCAEKDVIDIQRILHGQRVFDFHVEMAIPPQVYTMFSEKQYFDTEKRKNVSKLYPIKTGQDTLINKLVEYLDCYIGVRNFNIVISYRDGEPDMLLIV